MESAFLIGCKMFQVVWSSVVHVFWCYSGSCIYFSNPFLSSPKAITTGISVVVAYYYYYYFFFFFIIIIIIIIIIHVDSVLKKCTLFGCQCILHKSTNWGHYYHVSNFRRDRHFAWSSEPCKGLAACRTLAVQREFLHYSVILRLKTLSIGPAPGIDQTRDLPLCSQTLYRLS